MPLSQPPRAILFDLDDTLLDDTGDVVQLWRDVTFEAAERGRIDGEKLLREIERVRLWYWDDPERHREGRQDLRAATRWIVREAVHSSVGTEHVELGDWIAEVYRDRRDAALRLFPGAAATIERVRTAGVRTALLTNGSAAAQRDKIERFDLARHFDSILIEGELGWGKPDPRVYRRALADLGLEAAETWMVGDNLEWDVAAPQRLGIYGIWIDHKGNGVPPERAVRPDRIIRRIDEL